MTTTAKNTARTLFAAALAATLTIGASATLAFADYNFDGGYHYRIDGRDLTSDEALAIACASFGVDRSRLIGAHCFLTEYFGQACYQVSFMTPGGPDPMGGYASYYITHYTAYIDTVTGAVLYSYTM